MTQNFSELTVTLKVTTSGNRRADVLSFVPDCSLACRRNESSERPYHDCERRFKYICRRVKIINLLDCRLVDGKLNPSKTKCKTFLEHAPHALV